MDYATDYDVGESKRDGGINEDSVAVLVFEDGHREGVAREGKEEDADPARRSDSADATGGAGDQPGDGAGEAGQEGASRSEDTQTEDLTIADVLSDEGPDAATTGTDQNPEREGRNRSTAVFALADGAGGHEAGDVASYLASTVVCEHLAETAVRAARCDPDPFDVEVGASLPTAPTTDDLQAAIEDAVIAAHRAVLDYAVDVGQAAYTTVVAGIAVGGELHYGWVGDSRAYVCNRRHETIERLTTDHGVVTQLAESGEIDEVEAMVHPRGNEITRALGGTPVPEDDPTVEVDLNTIDLYGDDLVLVTSDGLIDAQTDAPDLYEAYVAADRSEAAAETVRDAVVTEAEIRDVVLEADSLETAASDLVALANDRGGKDNISTLLFGDAALGDPPATEPARGVADPPPVEQRDTVVLKEE